MDIEQIGCVRLDEQKTERFALFIEYLRRNKTYKNYCQYMQDTGNKFDWHLNPHGDENSNYLWITFGDVFLKSIDQLLKNYGEPDMPAIGIFDLSKEIDNIKMYTRELYRKAYEREPTIDEFSKWIERRLVNKSWFFVKVDLSVKHNLSKARKEFDNTIEGKVRKQRGNNDISISNLKMYLEIYDLYKAKKPWKEIFLKTVGRDAQKSDFTESEQRKYQRYKKKAEKYIEFSISCISPFHFPNRG